MVLNPCQEWDFNYLYQPQLVRFRRSSATQITRVVLIGVGLALVFFGMFEAQQNGGETGYRYIYIYIYVCINVPGNSAGALFGMVK